MGGIPLSGRCSITALITRLARAPRIACHKYGCRLRTCLPPAEAGWKKAELDEKKATEQRAAAG